MAHVRQERALGAIGGLGGVLRALEVDLHREPAHDFVLQRAVAGLERGGAFAHAALEQDGLRLGLLDQRPLFGQRIRQLENLDRVEGLLQHDEPVGVAQTGQHVLPRILGIGGADDDLQVGGDLPQLERGLDAVPAGRHPDIDKRHSVGAAVGDGLLDALEAFGALMSAVDVEVGPGPAGRDTGAEHFGLECVERGGGFADGRAENFPDVSVNGRIVVDHEDAVIPR